MQYSLRGYFTKIARRLLPVLSWVSLPLMRHKHFDILFVQATPADQKLVHFFGYKFDTLFSEFLPLSVLSIDNVKVLVLGTGISDDSSDKVLSLVERNISALKRFNNNRIAIAGVDPSPFILNTFYSHDNDCPLDDYGVQSVLLDNINDASHSMIVPNGKPVGIVGGDGYERTILDGLKMFPTLRGKQFYVFRDAVPKPSIPENIEFKSDGYLALGQCGVVVLLDEVNDLEFDALAPHLSENAIVLFKSASDVTFDRAEQLFSKGIRIYGSAVTHSDVTSFPAHPSVSSNIIPIQLFQSLVFERYHSQPNAVGIKSLAHFKTLSRSFGYVSRLQAPDGFSHKYHDYLLASDYDQPINLSQTNSGAPLTNAEPSTSRQSPNKV